MPPVRKRRLFTVGYEGRSLDEFVADLLEAGVRRVIDVRELPLSRRKGFSKTKLSHALTGAGIEYVHLRAAGNPFRDLRKNIERCLRMYRGYIEERPEVIDELDRLTVGGTAALLCVEAAPEACHRSILVEEMKNAGLALKVHHL